MKPLLLLIISIFFVHAARASEVLASDAGTLLITLKNHAYAIEPSTDTVEQAKQSLTPAEYEMFRENRMSFLNLAAKALQSLKWGFGAGMVIKNHFNFKSEKSSYQKWIEEARRSDEGQRDDILLALQREQPALDAKWRSEMNKTYQQKSDQLIVKILNSLDSKLWDQAAIVAESNEFGVMMAVGLQAEGGRAAGVGRGGLIDFGISIGFNRTEKALAIQLFNDVESFKTTQMPVVLVAGLVGKFGPYIANQGKELTATGVSYYPPMVPGFSSSTNRSFMFGASSGLTWPPSPIGDMLTYSNSLKQSTLLRISLSPLVKGFLRIKSANLKQLAAVSFSGLMKLISSSDKKVNVLICERLF